MGEPLEALEKSTLCASTDRNSYAGSQWCSHLGLTLFSEPIESLCQALTSEGSYVGQWLAQVLLGAANLEQTKLLSTLRSGARDQSSGDQPNDGKRKASSPDSGWIIPMR